MDPDLDLVSAILEAIDAKLEDVWTSLPARITAVQGGLVTAEPTVRQPTGQVIPPVVGVRVIQPLVGSVGVGLPVSVGVEGLLLVCTLDPAAWMLRGATGAPLARERHGLGFSVFLPGVGPSSPAAPSVPTIGNLTHTAHPIALGDRLAAILGVLDNVLRTAVPGTPGQAELGFAALQAAWTGAFPTSLPSVESSDAEVTST
jgi:hypothetical protein